MFFKGEGIQRIWSSNISVLLFLVLVLQGNYSCEGANVAELSPRSDDVELNAPGTATLNHFPQIPVKRRSVTFSCSVDEDANPNATRFRWLRAGNPVLDVVTPIWTVDPVGLDSRTNISCYAYNSGGNGLITTIELDVYVPPTFIQTLGPYTGALFSNPEVSLSCRVECFPLCTISWYKDGVGIEDETDDRYYIKWNYLPANPTTGDFESIFSVLHFNISAWPGEKFNVLTDNANYSCVSSNNTVGPGVRSTTFFGVEFPPQNTATKDTIVVPEDTLPHPIECSSKAHPNPIYEWRYQNKVIAKGNRLILNYKIKRTDAGTYTCVAYNKHGSSQSDLLMNVTYVPTCSISRKEVDGKDMLICTAFGNPDYFDFVWSVKSENESLSINTVNSMVNDGKNGFLILDNDFTVMRTYRCVANNSVGEGFFCETDVAAYRPPLKVHACEQSSCYPATGNLLIGREKQLTATSTCGVNGPQRFCIDTHLKEKECFLCDTTDYTRNDTLKNHRVGQIIYRTKPGTRESTWWQSENGVENVTIQIDLEAKFLLKNLIILFATFRPSAMFIEKSYDFGQTWNICRYFAHNCRDTFPDIPMDSQNVSDVLCDQRYSGVEPSKNGELIYRFLPENIKISDPYANHIQNLLKMTNLRINLTRFHTFGDTLSDDRNEIQEKYYAISNMVLRGSCSCYGHASRCLPIDGVENTNDMFHGRCECTHNTKGLNCEDCEDFYNDLPWKPAYGNQTNACKTCDCNNHATSCHFDEAFFEFSGEISGGVCDNCQHNTQGPHCESCIVFFYHDPREDIQSPKACQPCDCDLRGSLYDGICDSVADIENNVEAGSCHCKLNVKGRRCNMCKEGFWNLQETNYEGCQNCTCSTNNNLGCNMLTGECT